MKNLPLIIISFLLLQINLAAQSGWYQQTSGTIENLYSVYFIDNDNGFIVGNYGTFLKTTDAGENWISHPTGTDEVITSVQFLNPNIGFAVANLNPSARVMKTTDGGENWVTQVLNPAYPVLFLQTIQFTDSNTGWAAGLRGDWDSSYALLYKTTDGGSVWFEVTTPISSYHSILTSLHFTDPDNGWISGWWGKYDSLGYTTFPIVKTTNGGESWIDQSISIEYAWAGGIINSVHFVNESIGWVVGGIEEQGESYSRIFKTTDGGSNWIRQEHPTYPILNLSSVFFIDENTGWTVSTTPLFESFYIIYGTTNGGADWIEQGQETAISLNDVFFADENNGWAVGYSGKILHTINGGVLFTEENTISEIPADCSITQNFPNPFNPGTKIKYSLPQTSQVQIVVFDVLGNRFETLVNEEKPAGTYELTWNAANLPTGVYFYQLIAGDYVVTKKMLLIK